MLPHTGLSWLMKVALQIRIRGPFKVCSPFISRQCWLKNAAAVVKMPARCSTLLRFSPCKRAFALKILRTDEM